MVRGIRIGHPRPRALAVNQGTFTHTGQTLSLTAQRRLTAAHGAFTHTGQSVTFPVPPSGQLYFSQDFNGASLSLYEPSQIVTSNLSSGSTSRPGTVVMLSNQNWDGQNCLGIGSTTSLAGQGGVYIGLTSFPGRTGTAVAGDEFWIGFSVYFPADYVQSLRQIGNGKWGAWDGPDYFQYKTVGSLALFVGGIISPNVNFGAAFISGGKATFGAAAVDISTNRINLGSGWWGEWPGGGIVTYSTTGTPIGGLTNGAQYYLAKSGTSFGLTQNTLNAYNQTNLIDLTSQGSGTHSLLLDCIFSPSLNTDKWLWLEIGYIPAEKRACLYVTSRDGTFNMPNIIGVPATGMYETSGGQVVAVPRAANRLLLQNCITDRTPVSMGQHGYYENYLGAASRQRIGNFRIANRQALVAPPAGF